MSETTGQLPAADQAYGTSTAVIDPPPPPLAPVPAHEPPDRPERLYRIAAWFAIVAGGLVILAVVFGSGFFLGRETGSTGHNDNRRGGEITLVRPGEMPPFGRAERPRIDGQSPGERGPGEQGPGEQGPGQQFPNFPGLPQFPGSSEAPQRPSVAPSPPTPAPSRPTETPRP